MAGGLSLDHPWAFTFGILGNIISFMVYLAPLPTFYRVYKKKSTEGFQSVPYVVALFSATLWIFYALLKTDACLLITINSVGCIIESLYIILYLIYAPKKTKLFTIKLVILVNVVVYGLIVFLTLFSAKGPKRVVLLGWICMSFSVSVFVAPLSIIRLVIRTKSVEFMPFFLSFFLTVSAVVWFGYGLLTKDMYVALPNVLGFLFGVLQMMLYVAYKDRRIKVIAEHKLTSNHIVSIAKINGQEPEDNNIKVMVQDVSTKKEGEREEEEEGKEKAEEATADGGSEHVVVTITGDDDDDNAEKEETMMTSRKDDDVINKEGAVAVAVRA